jgi:nucleoside-diphosphate-sugar epimerase
VSGGGAGTVLFGGSGFLGSAILRLDPDIISVGRTRPSTPHRHVQVASLDDLGALDGVAFDKVIYAVGSSDRQRLGRARPGEPTAFDYHVTPLLATLEQIQHRPLRQFINFSTILLYDEARLTPPVSEDAPIAPYSGRHVFSMHVAEEICRFYGPRVPILTIRLSNMYGPTVRPGHDFIDLLIRQILSEGRAEIWSRRPARDFIHVDDAARAVLALVETSARGVLNLGTGVMTPVATIANHLQAMSGCPIVDRDIPVSGPMRFACDLTRLRSVVDWSARHTIESGLRDTYEAMRAYRG